MPSLVVKITWDTPDDPEWLNPYNVELVLAEYCPNTAFEVTQVSEMKPVRIHDVAQFYPVDDDEASGKT